MMAIAITPDGRTAYVVSACGCAPVVTPVATATNTPGKPIKIGGSPWAIAITPDGKTAYVLDDLPIPPTLQAGSRRRPPGSYRSRPAPTRRASRSRSGTTLK